MRKLVEIKHEYIRAILNFAVRIAVEDVKILLI